MAKPKKIAAPKPELWKLDDINVCAPDYFSVAVGCANSDAAVFLRRAEAFYKTMYSLDRAVMLCYDSAERRLYLASVEESPKLEGADREP